MADGELVDFVEDGPTTFYKEGAILGVEQFLFNRPWDKDLIARSNLVICKISYEFMLDLSKGQQKQVQAAAAIWRCAMRHMCYSHLYDDRTKLINQHHFDFKHMKDEHLMIDFKLDMKDQKDKDMFKLFKQANQGVAPKREPKNVETIQYFLSDQFKDYIQDHEAA